MEIISGTKEFYISSPTAVAIGKFDGVHIGHQRLLMEIAKDGLKSCIFTFDPAPSVFFGKEKGLLTTRKEKRVLLERKGIDILVEFPFDAQTAGMEPVNFLDELVVGKMGAELIAAGEDLSFGNKGAGNSALLKKYGEENRIDVRIIEKISVSIGDEGPEYEVSSTLIRELILSGKMEEAEELLGIPYFIFGTVVHGNHMGAGLGFPTINLIPEDDKLLPPNGVYTSDVIIGGKKYRGLTNIGTKPTVSDKGIRGVETYIYDYDSDAYGMEAELYLKSFRRPEMKFSSVDELKNRLAKDISENRK